MLLYIRACFFLLFTKSIRSGEGSGLPDDDWVKDMIADLHAVEGNDKIADGLEGKYSQLLYFAVAYSPLLCMKTKGHGWTSRIPIGLLTKVSNRMFIGSVSLSVFIQDLVTPWAPALPPHYTRLNRQIWRLVLQIAADGDLELHRSIEQLASFLETFEVEQRSNPSTTPITPTVKVSAFD